MIEPQIHNIIDIGMQDVIQNSKKKKAAKIIRTIAVTFLAIVLIIGIMYPFNTLLGYPDNAYVDLFMKYDLYPLIVLGAIQWYFDK